MVAVTVLSILGAIVTLPAALMLVPFPYLVLVEMMGKHIGLEGFHCCCYVWIDKQCWVLCFFGFCFFCFGGGGVFWSCFWLFLRIILFKTKTKC